jgi:hypothetical protein
MYVCIVVSLTGTYVNVNPLFTYFPIDDDFSKMCKFLSIWPLVRFKYIASFNFFCKFYYRFILYRQALYKIRFVKPIKGSLYTKLTEQHDHNMQLKKTENKIAKFKMKNKNICASALIQLCNVKIFPCKYALWRKIKCPPRHIMAGVRFYAQTN